MGRYYTTIRRGPGSSVETRPLAAAGTHVIAVPLSDFRPWSPEAPNLYTAKVELVAADEAGVLVQAELPYNADVCCEHFAFDPIRDVRELYLNYRRHPSFAVYSMGTQVGTAFPPHPCYGDFPNGGCLTPLWFRLVKVGRPLPDAAFDARGLVAVGEGGTKCYVYLAERSKSFHVFGLDLVTETPEGASLLDNFIDYAAGK